MHRYRFTGPDGTVFPGLATADGTAVLKTGDILEVADPVEHPWLVPDPKAKTTVRAAAAGAHDIPESDPAVEAAEVPATPEED